MSSSIFYKNNKGFTHTPKSLVSGFTLIELLVVIAISTILMTTLVFQQSKWNDSLIVSTQAYELALMIRQAQIYSLGVRENTAGTGDKFDVGYGIYFDKNYVDANGNVNRYVFFADKNDADMGKYNAGDTIIETKTFIRGVIISRFCGKRGTNERCSPDAGNVARIGITFFRPDPKANVGFFNNGSDGGQPSTNVNPPAKIYLQSPGGKQYSVNVEDSGQISVTQI